MNELTQKILFGSLKIEPKVEHGSIFYVSPNVCVNADHPYASYDEAETFCKNNNYDVTSIIEVFFFNHNKAIMFTPAIQLMESVNQTEMIVLRQMNKVLPILLVKFESVGLSSEWIGNYKFSNHEKTMRVGTVLSLMLNRYLSKTENRTHELIRRLLDAKTV